MSATRIVSIEHLILEKNTQNMIIYFGLQLEDSYYPASFHISKNVSIGTYYCGKQNLLSLLEIHLGLVGHPNNNNHIRVEQYRQALKNYLIVNKTAFFQASFDADELATSNALLAMRDELILANWNFELEENMPIRLRTLALIETGLNNPEATIKLNLNVGFSDRIQLIIEALESQKAPFEQVYLNEPLELLPNYLQVLFNKLKQQDVVIQQLSLNERFDDSDLGVFRKALFNKQNGKRTKVKAKGDGSLVILEAKRETSAAEFLAKLFRDNPTFRPVCLVPEKNRALDNALIEEGLPSLGIQSASLARPVLQILKLVPTFLWRPIDPYKIMEFVSLAVKPLRDDLAYLIAGEIAQTPGLLSDRWRGLIQGYFEDLDKRAISDKSINVKAARKQYDFWFTRQRRDINSTVSIMEVIEIFEEVSAWASKEFEALGSKQSSLLVLSEQAKRICELLQAFPETEKDLTYLQVERIVKTIYEPSPVTFKSREIGYLPVVHHSSSVIKKVDELLWWDFSQNEIEHFFARWYQNEVIFLQAKSVTLQSPKDDNTLLLWQRPRAILHCHKTLFLVVSEMVEGKTVQPHPLHSDLEAVFENLEDLVVNVSKIDDNALDKYVIQDFEKLETRNLGQPKAYLTVTNGKKIAMKEEETFTSLDSLFYYPYKWVFKYKLGLKKTSILSVVKDTTLMGNLSHRLFEILFKEKDVLTWEKSQVEKWVSSRLNSLLEREGAVLLMYGREPEKTAFVNTLKYAAWSLIEIIRNNNWQIEGTEQLIEGTFNGIPVKAKADLVLKNAKGALAILDLKWRGASRRQNMIKSEEDLQLVMYSTLLTKDERIAQTAFYIIEDAKMIARNNEAFKEAIAVLPDKDFIQLNQLIWRRMLKTHQWRIKQLQEGRIEVRTEMTFRDLEEPNENGDTSEFDNFLEMKSKDAPFDDYKTLINLIE
jgi:hypothetical protein